VLVFGTKYNRGLSHKWIYIEDALQGAIKGLRCPFCDTALVAKKPTKDKSAHFSHKKRACPHARFLRRSIKYLPAPQYWLYGISLGEKRLFNKLHRQRRYMDNDKFISDHRYQKTTNLLGKPHPYLGYEDLGKAKKDTLEKLLERKLVQIAYHEFGLDVFELSWKTKLLWDENQPLKNIYLTVKEEWEHWQERSRWEDWTVTNLFSQASKRIKKAFFYLLKITIDNKVIYKTGTTVLSYEEIEKWEYQQLKNKRNQIDIEKIYYTDSIALIEPFIQYKYKKYRHKIGYQTGYFDLKKKFPDFKQDLHQVTLLSKQHREKIKEGLKKAKNVGKRGKETLTDFLAKPKSKDIIAFLEDTAKNWSLRSIAFNCDCSVNTVQKVKRLWKNQAKKYPE